MANTEFTEVRALLDDLHFPAGKEEIVQHAEQHADHDDPAVRLLRALPLGTYDNMSEIRRSVPLNLAADDGLDSADMARRARSKHSERIAEHLREPTD